MASRNDSRLISCEVAGDQFDYVVSVRVETAVPVRIPGVPTQLNAVAYAGPVPAGEAGG